MDNFVFHHVGIAVREMSTSIESYRTSFGYINVAGPFEDPIQNVKVCFLSRAPGDPVLELVAPLGPNSPIDRALKKGGGLYHLCYEVSNIEEAIAHLTEHGSLLLSGPVPAVAFAMRRIAWLMTDAELLVEIVER
jgi:methylmalonyl-CoA/ethylmalonyl-CoA epimerase